METAGRIAVLAVTAALCSVVVKQNAKEMALVLSLAAGAIIFMLALGAVDEVRRMMDELGQRAGISPAILEPVYKTVGISILTRISSEVCRDAGESGIAAFVETAGTILALCGALPLLQAVLDTIASLL